MIKKIKFPRLRSYLLFILFVSPFFIYPQSSTTYAPIPLPLLPKPGLKFATPTYILKGNIKNIQKIKNILSENKFSESKNAEYIIEGSQNNIKVIRSKGNITLGSFENTDSSLDEFQSLLDAESGYVSMIAYRNNGNNDHKISDLFSKAEIGKEGARVGESIELEFVYRSKSKKNGYLSIFLFTTDGTIAQIFPNKYDPDNLLLPNDNYKFPTSRAKKPYKIEASPPIGNDRLILILSENPLPLNSENTQKFGHLIVVHKNKRQEIENIIDFLNNLGSFALYELILDIKD